jgi:Ca2+-binding RTX toxin-like protein
MAIELNLNDLQFVLKQIKIGEAHANGAALTEIRLDPVTGEVITSGLLYDANGVFTGDASWPRAIPDAKTPFGIRTVDGSYNNLMEGRELWGAADQLMPRYLDANYIDGGPETPIDINGPVTPGGLVSNTDYGSAGHVVDSDPRVISNLVVDMSVNNPAALYAALVFAESEDPHADLAALLAARASGGADLTALEAALAAAEAAFQAAAGAYNPADSTTWDAIQTTGAALTAAEEALAAAEASSTDPEAAFLAMATEMGILDDAGDLIIPNVAPDEGISAPFNAWMTFFGQFFDHGLDLITKGGNGTIFVPLKPDDPLITHGPDGIAGSGDEVPANLAFMALTRATPTIVDGVAEHTNTTTPFVDQNQTYTSHASHQVFLREYVMGPDGPVATGRLLGGQDGGLATWGDIKAQAANVLGIQLTDGDALNIPLIYTDAYGEFVRDGNGMPQIVTGINPDGTPSSVVSGSVPGAVNTFTAGALRIGHAFIDDIAHTANPFNSQNPSVLKVRDDDGQVNDTNANGIFDVGEVALAAGVYDGDLFDRHFITGDGRGNENFGLTAVHHVFHSEHNRQTVIQKLKILEEGDLGFVNQWLSTTIDAGELTALHTALDAAVDKHAFIEGLTLDWDGERIFQAARFATEMQYQHLVFEEFGRKIQPAIDPFVFNSVTDINPAIFAEFANVVYRFGHSMLTEVMPRSFYDPNGTVDEAFLNTVDEGLIAAFLDPVDFDLDGTISHEQAAGAVIRGLTNVRGNAIDEFVIDALRNNLLGLPLDLAAINITRGRDTGMPTLNEAREQLFASTGHSFLRPYSSWADFSVGLKNPLSVVNFVAAYGTHTAITTAATLVDKRAAAMELVFGVEADGVTPSDIADRLDFINGTGAYAGTLGGLNSVDLWIGGLAEKILLFGGMLGSTFTAVFEAQMEALQDADRFYYLTRTQGLNFLDALENNAFSKMIMANTDLTEPGLDGIRGTADDIIRHHIGIDSFGKYDLVLEADAQYQQDYNGAEAGKDPNDIDPVLAGLGFTQVGRDLPPAFQAYYDTYLRYIGGEHVVLGGTSGRDVLIGDLGDEGIWGDAGNDYIEGGQGVDLIMGGADDDVILDEGDEGDFIKGDAGNDVIASSNGLDVLMGGEGKDVVFTGKDDTEVFGGEGDDFVLGGDGVDLLMGNEGNDWLEAGGGFDTTAGDNSQLFFNSDILGHDVMLAGSEEHDFDAESGDDIMVQGESVMRNEGMFGFDWVSYQGSTVNADADMRIRIFTTEEADILRNRFDKVEALSGGEGDDVLRGDDREAGDAPEIPTINNTEALFFKDELSQAGLDRVEGLRELLGDLVAGVPVGSSESIVAFTGGNLLLGGAGGDTLQGNGGNDFLDGNARLNVRIRLTEPGDENTAANEIATIYTLKHVFDGSEGASIPAGWIGQSLFELLISRAVVPGQMHIVREIIADDGDVGDVDTAVFNDTYLDDNGDENYAISLNADGSLRVEHVTVTVGNDPVTGRPLISDGIDTLRNVEFLRFADGVVISVNELLGQAATGTPLILDPTPTGGQVSPAERQVLAVDVSQIDDPNGIASAFSYQWQYLDGGVWTNLAGATGATFQPNDPNFIEQLSGDISEIGFSLRVAVSFVDGLGTLETVYSAPTLPVVERAGIVLNGTPLVNNVLNGGVGDDTLTGVDPSPTGGNDTLNGAGGEDVLNGLGGNDTLNGGGHNDVLRGGAGDDIVRGGTGDDVIIWQTGDGRDRINGDVGTDTFVLNGDANAETFRIYTRDAAIAAGMTGIGTGVEIVVTRNGTNNASIIARLDNIEEIIVNTLDVSANDGNGVPNGGNNGGDTIQVIGDFTATSLDYSTITINGSSDNDTVDFSALSSAHRVVFRSNGGSDTIVGTIRPQDVVELAPGEYVNGYSLVDNGNGTQTFTNGVHSVTFAGDVPQFQNGPSLSNGLLDDEDIEDLLAMAQDPDFVRDASGYGNNVDNPNYGTAGQQFIRLTDAHYTDGTSGIRQTALNPREISNILANQDEDGDGVEESIVNQFGGTSLLTFFGQYFDHGLDFVAKGQPGSVYIGDVGVTPLMAPRSNIVPGTGVDPDGIPNSGDEIPAEYINNASPFVDQNQAYGSTDAVTDILRRWEVGQDGSPVQTAYLLSGDIDDTGHTLLPTLAHIRDNFRVMTDGGELTSDDVGDYQGSGQPLLIDFIPRFILLPDGSPSEELDLDQIGHFFVAGDGRANENVMLTSIHTIWHRNHNFWVDELKARTNNEWTEEEYFEAARIRNIAEYQRVVFTEFATAMAGGFDDDNEHGFEGYDETIDASISVEFAQAAYRFGHSMLNETVSYEDENGDLQDVSLVQAFLNPAQLINLGVSNLLAGSVQVEHQAIDENVVNALRNQLVGRPLDLAALNIFRGRDMGIAPFNSVRTQLYEQTNLSALRPYTGWADFALRNGVSAAMLAKLQEAYPDGFETMDLWVGGLLEKPVAGQLGSTFGYIFLEQLNRLQHGDRLYYLEIFDDSLFADESDVTFADIIARNTGLTDLPENVFDLNGSNATADDDDHIFDNVDEDVDGDDDDVDDDTDDDTDDDVGEDDDDDDDDDDDIDDDDDDSDDDDVDDAPTVGGPIVATPAGGVLMGTSGADLIIGAGGVDYVIAGAGADVLRLGEGDDFADGGAGPDVVWGGIGNDDILGGGNDDMLYGEAGSDWISGGHGDDLIDGGTGADELFGGDGNDTFLGRIGDGNDLVDGGADIDMLDLGLLTEAVEVDLGTGVGGRGHVTGSQSGTDTLYRVENVVTGSGNDTIIASNAVNVVDGGDGEDVFVFGSAAAADGDTIVNFEAGDKVDLSDMLEGSDSFTLVTGTPAAGEIAVTHEVREDGEYTVVTGTSEDGEPDFRISITGNHNLTSSDFNL